MGAGKLVFLASCNRFRETSHGEKDWQVMMSNKRAVTRDVFASLCDLATLLVKGESWENVGHR